MDAVTVLQLLRKELQGAKEDIAHSLAAGSCSDLSDYYRKVGRHDSLISIDGWAKSMARKVQLDDED